MNDRLEEASLRHEWKHVMNPSDAAALRMRLGAILRHDPHQPGPYRIRSLYFDNPYDKALREKLDGLHTREKFRIRYYNEDDSFIHVEKKAKKNHLTAKKAASVTRAQCEDLLAGDTDWMLQTGDPLLCELHAKMQYQLLRPRTLVDYTREAFVYGPGNVRVTIDSDIRTGMGATALFDPVAMLPVDATRPVVLEVKYDEYLPDLVRDLVQTPGRHTAPFSKYAASRVFG